MNSASLSEMKSQGLGFFINRIQTLFVGLLRVWTIPIVLMLSICSGFTTYYGLSHFIVPWIALVITVAIQSIIVICSLELAGIHWKANKMRYFSVVASLIIALAASISFSYFKFYEISEQSNLHINRLAKIRQDIKSYLNQVLSLKAETLQQHKKELAQASQDVSKPILAHMQKFQRNYAIRLGKGRSGSTINRFMMKRNSVWLRKNSR